MKKIIDLDEETRKKLEHMVIDSGARDLKNYIQDVLREHAKVKVKKKKEDLDDY